MTERTRSAAPNIPIRILFISHECKQQRFTERAEYTCWYEGAIAFYGGSRVKVGIAYQEGSEEAGASPGASGPSPDSRISYYPLTVNLQHGATGPEWEDARRALIDVVNRFEPDVVQ